MCFLDQAESALQKAVAQLPKDQKVQLRLTVNETNLEKQVLVI